MIIVGTSELGNLVAVEMRFGDTGIALEFTSKNTVILDSLDKDVTFVGAINKVKSVLCDESFGL
ncbi:hypothetical protein [Romboutsia sp.]|uniref:hypothetical protein n=1 Tax=Romboutsia sp. TaxID=1965302 RepID=UPI002C8D70EB|nr:hypothetical protein [Romboutsia sp.]HSQ90197.1 hypothetical protein [Romboutsia sp.]